MLGILTAIAVPSIVDLRKSSWNARLVATAGTFSGALQRAKALCKMTGVSGAATIDLAATGGALDFDANCYPMGTTWASGTPTDANCLEVWQALMRGTTGRVQGALAQADIEAFSVANQCAYRFLKTDGSHVSTAGSYAAMVAYYFAGGSVIIYYRDLDDNVVTLVPSW